MLEKPSAVDRIQKLGPVQLLCKAFFVDCNNELHVSQLIVFCLQVAAVEDVLLAGTMSLPFSLKPNISNPTIVHVFSSPSTHHLLFLSCSATPFDKSIKKIQ